MHRVTSEHLPLGTGVWPSHDTSRDDPLAVMTTPRMSRAVARRYVSRGNSCRSISTEAYFRAHTGTGR